VTEAPGERPALWALANVSIALIFGAVVAAALQGGVRDVGVMAPFGATLADRATLVPLPVTGTTDGEITRAAVLRVQQAFPTGLAEIRLRFDTYGSTPRLAGGTLRIGETCRFDADPGTLRSGEFVLFRRVTPCDGVPAEGTAATLSLRFSERAVQDARCALLAAPVHGNSYLLGIEFGGGMYVLLGQQISLRSDATTPRASLLAYMWGRSATFVWLVFGAAEILIVGAGALLAFRRVRLNTAALTALAAGLALAYAILVPPLQAPDEPNHLLGYAAAIEQGTLAEQSEAWGRALHFERITFHPDERFRPSNIGEPLASPWGAHVTATDELSRSALNVRYWRLLARALEGAGPSATLLGIRVANSLVFGGVVGLACLLVFLSGERQTGHLIPLALMLVPTLPFFAMHMSNYALLTSGYVLLAAGVAAICHGRTESGGVGLLIGLGISIAMATSLGSLPMLAVVGAALVAGVAGRADRGPRYLFWGMFVLGAVAISVAPAGADPLSKAGVYRGLASRVLAGWPWIAIAIGVAGVGMDRLLAGVKGQRRAGGSVAVARGLQLSGAVIGVVALASLAYRYPLLQAMETREAWPTPAGYALEVFTRALTLGRLAHPDWLLSSSFWGGFGWLDAYPGDWMVNLLTGATVAALVGLLLATAHARDNKKAVRLLLVGCGAAAALVIYAAGASVQRTNLHGRYLFGLYLCGVGICWSVMAVAGASAARRVQAATTFLFAAMASVHAASLVFVLRRYF
jgi:hypothetical protein